MPRQDWSQLTHAFGSAEDVPALIAAVTQDPNADVWGELWVRLCHQGTVYSASFAALPDLLHAAAAWAPRDRTMALSLAAAIVCGETVAGEREGLRDDYQPIRSALEALAREALRAPGLSEDDFIYTAQAVLAFSGDCLWGLELNHLSSGEFEGQCPACGTYLFLVVGQYGFFTAADEWITRPETTRVPIEPVPTQSLSGLGEWLHAEAVRASLDRLAMWIRYVFGSTTCPACAARTSVHTAIENLARGRR